MLKGRYWAFVMYPESMPFNWYDLLQETGLPIAISPLHDKDLNPDNEPKKPHYHVICYYENTTTKKNVQENVCSKVNGTIPIKLESLRGMYRYHLHLDNPEKYQYSDKDRIFINNFDVDRVESLTSTEIDKILFELQQIILDKKIVEYGDLMDLLHNSDMVNYWSVARNHTIFLKNYIDSRRYKTKLEKNNLEVKKNS